MPDATDQGFPYPLPGDDIRDYPATAQLLAERLDVEPAKVTPVEFAALVPVDGLQVLLEVSVGTLWHLRYNAASASAYKWEFLGGSPATAIITTNEVVTGTNGFTDATTPGPTITVPRSGEYDAELSVDVDTGNTGTVVYSAIKIGAAATLAANGIQSRHYAGGIKQTESGRVDGFVAVAGDAIKLQHSTQVGFNAGVQYRRLSIRPRRVS